MHLSKKLSLLHLIVLAVWVTPLSSANDIATSSLPQCTKKEITYTYTECDQVHGRWSIQVPINPNQCQVSQPQAPVRRDTCDFNCDAGYYFNLATQSCQECPVGTYSLGGGIRFDSWDKLSAGFTSHSEAVGFALYGYKSKVNNCSLSLWKPFGHSVVSNDDDCTSTLSYSVNLKQPGSVSFTYQYSDSDIIFHFFVQNNQCLMSQVHEKNAFLNTTGTEWKTWTANLNEGPNLLNWQTTGIMLSNQKLNPVRIRSIEVTGVSYATECLKCRPGSFASEPGSTKCAACPIDEFSAGGSAMCQSCDTEREFAPSGSGKCLPKPPCQSKDYFATHSPCDEDKMTTITYKWVEPKVCRDTLDGSVTLPPTRMQPCSPCNPSFQPTDSDCKPCLPNTFSNGTHECRLCPASTSPHYGLFYLWWDYMPETIKTSCISLSTEDCINQEGWEAIGDQLQTLAIHAEDAYLLLVLNLRGFLSEIEKGIYGQITFAFQTECEGLCQLYFMKDLHDDGTSVVEGWTGLQAKQTYTYDIAVNDTTLAFTWAFKKSTGFDIAHIYFINVTNAIGSSADACEPCAAGLDDAAKCIPCPAGNYLDLDTHKCKECNENTIVSTDKTSCVECGSGTFATSDKTKCTSDCHFYSVTTNRHYDFTNMSAITSTQTLPSFTNSGKQYNHIYNFSLCNNEGRGLAECVDNVTFAHGGLFNLKSLERLSGMVCRSTAIPMFTNDNNRVTVHSQPTVVASKLLAISQESANDTNNIMFPKDTAEDLNDVIYHMRSPPTNTEECPEGRNTFIFLRCSPDIQESSGRIEMMNDCPDGTCNGCDFYFLWRSKAACPICTGDDYKTVVGGCEDGIVTTTYLWKRYPQMCRDGVSLPNSTVKSCTDIMMFVKIGVMAAIAILLLTCILICFLYKKNKKLEYKYHRLVVNGIGGKNEEELPAADSCALTDSESDFEGESDEVIFQKKKSRLFGKKKVSNYESVSLKPATTGV